MKFCSATLMALMLLGLAGEAQAGYADYVLSTDPTIYWQFEETFDNYSATNVAGDAASIGGLNNGTGGFGGIVTSGPATGGTGILGSAAVFTNPATSSAAGSQGGQAIEVSGLTAAGVGTTEYSIQLWVQSSLEISRTETSTDLGLNYFFGRSTNSDPSTSTSLLPNTQDRSDYLCYASYKRDPMVRFVDEQGNASGGDNIAASGDDDGDSSTNYTNLSGTNAASAMGWHHLVMTRSGSNVAIYLDGTLEVNLSGDTLDTNYISDCLTIGGRSDYVLNGCYGFNGLIDEVAVWDYALSSEDVTALANINSTVDVPEPSTLTLLFVAAFSLLAWKRNRK